MLSGSLPTGNAARSVRYQGAFNTFFTSDTELVVAWQEPSKDGLGCRGMIEGEFV
jgi:hypothetical protein